MDNLRWGILATGGIARGFCSDLVKCQQHKILAVTSRSKRNAEVFAQEFGSDKTAAYDNYAQMLSNPDVDVIYVATPHVFHFDNTIQALNAGKHVVCEKPIGMSVQEVETCAKVALEKNLFLLEAVWMNFFPTVKQAKDWITQGKIGQVKHLEANFDFLAPKSPEHRLNNLSLGGGALMDIGLYPLFFATHLLGEAQVIQGTCVKSDTGIDSLACLNLQHQNGISSLCRFTFLVDRPCEAYIYGEHGVIKLDDRFFCGKSLSLHVNGKAPLTKNFEGDFRGDGIQGEEQHGYHFEINATYKAIRAKEIETDTYPHSEMLSNHQLLAQARQHLNINYQK